MESEFSSDYNDTVSTLFHYGSEDLFNTEVPRSVTPILMYSVVTVTLLTIWYWLFIRPFDWNRVIILIIQEVNC